MMPHTWQTTADPASAPPTAAAPPPLRPLPLLCPSPGMAPLAPVLLLPSPAVNQGLLNGDMSNFLFLHRVQQCSVHI